MLHECFSGTLIDTDVLVITPVRFDVSAPPQPKKIAALLCCRNIPVRLKRRSCTLVFSDPSHIYYNLRSRFVGVWLQTRLEVSNCKHLSMVLYATLDWSRGCGGRHRVELNPRPPPSWAPSWISSLVLRALGLGNGGGVDSAIGSYTPHPHTQSSLLYGCISTFIAALKQTQMQSLWGDRFSYGNAPLHLL